MKEVAARALALLDLTSLNDDDTNEKSSPCAPKHTEISAKPPPFACGRVL